MDYVEIFVKIKINSINCSPFFHQANNFTVEGFSADLITPS